MIVTPEAYLKASNAEALDAFGVSVDVSGDTILVGADGEDSGAGVVDGDQSLNDAPSAGAVYVFVRGGTTWTQQAYLKIPYFLPDYFGQRVALDGDTALITGSGGLHFFERTGTTWAKTGSGSYDGIGSGAGLSGDWAIVSNYTASPPGTPSLQIGEVLLYERIGTDWNGPLAIVAPNGERFDWFGFSVGISGDTFVAGAPAEDSGATGVNGNLNDNSLDDAGAAYVFVRTGGTWSLQAYLKASNAGSGDEFGRSVAIDGDTIAVGAWREASTATGVDGDQSSDGALDAGAVYVFVRSGSTWTQQAYLKASNTEGNDRFGSRLDLDGDRLVVSASLEDGSVPGVDGDPSDNNAGNAGAAYVFERTGTTWAQIAYLKATSPGPFDELSTVAISGDVIVCGAEDEDSAATRIDGDASDDSASNAGAAYAFGIGTLPPAKVYCTAKLNSDGCAPMISTAAGPPRTIDASLVLADKNGLLFYGLNGPAVLPFSGAVLCVFPPLRRTLVQSSFGVGPCGGSYTFDLDAWIDGGNDPLLVPGTRVNAQYWYRAPLDSFGVGLSDAVELFVVP